MAVMDPLAEIARVLVVDEHVLVAEILRPVGALPRSLVLGDVAAPSG